MIHIGGQTSKGARRTRASCDSMKNSSRTTVVPGARPVRDRRKCSTVSTGCPVARRVAAAACVEEGLGISLAHDLGTVPSAENPYPAQHHMLAAGDARGDSGIPGYEASRDWFATAVHGMGVTHVDALCHMFVRGRMYNDVPAEAVRSDGATRNTLLTLANGLVGRGVLLDIPGLRGVDGGQYRVAQAHRRRAKRERWAHSKLSRPRVPRVNHNHFLVTLRRRSPPGPWRLSARRPKRRELGHVATRTSSRPRKRSFRLDATVVE